MRHTAIAATIAGCASNGATCYRSAGTEPDTQYLSLGIAGAIIASRQPDHVAWQRLC